jgi:Tfp pilus assembly protein FimT
LKGIQLHNGVTIIELLTIMGVTIILTVLAVPSFISTIQTHRIRANAENLYYTLQYARSEAIKRNTTVYVSFITGDNWCYGLNTGSACTCTTPSGCNLGAYQTSSTQQTSLSVSGYNSNTIEFESTHAAANASGAITFTLYGKTSLIKISIGRLGNLQMCSTGISGYLAC